MTDTRAHVPHCPYCLSPVRPAEHSVVCSACGIPHHRECWQANSRCTTYGCIGQPIRVPLEATAEALEDELTVLESCITRDAELKAVKEKLAAARTALTRVSNGCGKP